MRIFKQIVGLWVAAMLPLVGMTCAFEALAFAGPVSDHHSKNQHSLPSANHGTHGHGNHDHHDNNGSGSGHNDGSCCENIKVYAPTSKLSIVSGSERVVQEFIVPVFSFFLATLNLLDIEKPSVRGVGPPVASWRRGFASPVSLPNAPPTFLLS